MLAKLKILTINSIVFTVFIHTTIAQKSSVEWKSPHTLTELHAAPVALIPFPQEVIWNREYVSLHNGVSIHFNQPVKGSARGVFESLSRLMDEQHIIVNPKANLALRLELGTDTTLKKEGYRLAIDKSSITLSAGDAPGLYYAVQTLRQLIIIKNKNAFVPACRITDWPAFGLRGFMHDNGRNFQSLEMLKAQLEILSHYKFNVFQWHLTDNPAWRIESKIYPQLNEAKNRKPGRDPDSTYSFNQIRELIRFAKDRHIQVIPEIDMPGHSAFFEPVFGFKMESDKGMQVLEELIDEFCKEIPVADCPVIHIGSDEVHIKNPQQFIERMTKKLHANGRQAMVWNPGLKPLPGTIQQVWYDGQTNKTERDSTQPFVDSYAGYLNLYDALSLIQRYFFQQPCNTPAATQTALGGILCCWPDTRVDQKKNIFTHNPVWPGAITYSEAIWCGRPGFDVNLMNLMPAQVTSAGSYFAEFEKRLAVHRDRFFADKPFPYVQFSKAEWQMYGPFQQDIGVSKAKSLHSKTRKNVYGSVVRVSRWLLPEMDKDTAIQYLYFESRIYSKSAKEIHAWVGFETPARSNRQSAGIPPNGEWDANGGAVYINNGKLKGPEWKNPGGNRYLKPTWNTTGNEVPYTDEEFYWTRQPATILLKAGWNSILIKAPRYRKDQVWMFAFVPVKKNAGRWVEDSSVTIKAATQ